MKVRMLAILLVLVFFFAASADLSFGQTLWQAGTGDWFTAANWTLGVPNSASGTTFDAIIANTGTAQLQAPGGSVRRLRVGLAGGPGNLLIDGGGTLNVTENLHLNEGSAGPASTTVQGGSTVTAPATVVGYSSAFSTSFLISGAGTVYNATTSFIVGQSGAGLATLTVQNGAVLASGTSTMASNGFGNATVDGAGSRWSSTGAFTVGSVGTGTLNIQNQGVVHVGTALSINGTSNVNLNGGALRFNTAIGSSLNRLNYTSGTIQLAGNRTLHDDASITYLFGPLLAPPAAITIPSGKGLHVEGTAFLFNGSRSATVSGGTLTSANFLFGNVLNGVGIMYVNNGGTVVTSVNATLGDVSGSYGTVYVSGPGSSWSIGGNAIVGASVDGTGALFIQDQSLVYVGTALSINTVSNVNVQGGTLRFNTVSGLNRLTYSSGTIQLAGDRGVGVDATITTLYGAFPSIPTGKGLTVEGTATLTKPVTLSGGAFKTTNLAVGAGGSLIFDHGILELTGGSVTGLANLVVPPNGEFRASSAQTTRITAAAGSTIKATDALTLGNAALPNGFYSNGDLVVGANVVTLADANDAVLDSAALVTLGAGGSPGTLAAANGLTLDFGGNLTGFGTINTPNNSAKPLINNGHITGDVGAPITLTGYVKGVGTLDNVVITGTDAPGFSPATVVRGSVVYDGTLEIEIGGTSLGSFDRIQHILGGGLAGLGGTLDVEFINGFNPALDDAFEIITAAAGVSGMFDTLPEELPALSSGLEWAINYGPNNVVLQIVAAGLAGDYNQDDVVDAADYTVWRNNLGDLTEDDIHHNGDGLNGVDAADYDWWKQHYGDTAPDVGSGAIAGSTGASPSPVPEPGTGSLLFMSALVLIFRRQSVVSSLAAGGGSRTP